MKILHLIDSGGLYGAEKMLCALCVEQRRAGHDARVLSARLPDQPEKAIDVELRKSNVPLISWPMQSGLNLRGMRAIHQWAVDEEIDVLHSHGYKFNVLIALTAARSRIPRITTVHGYTSGGPFSRIAVYNIFDRISHLAFDRVVYVCDPQRRYSLLASRTEATVPNGIDVAALPAASTPQKDPREKAVRLIAVGRLAAEKNFELLLHAVALLRERGLATQLDIFGKGPEEQKLRRVIERRQLDNVHLRGYSNDVPSELVRHDILVMSSTTEGMPITLLEAMCLGTRIVATPVGGIPSLLKTYPLAKLSKGHRPADLADAIEQQTRDTTSLEPTQQDALRHSLSSAVMSRRYTRIYEQCVEERALALERRQRLSSSSGRSRDE